MEQDHLRRLRELADEAATASGEQPRAVVLAQLQRVSAWALRDAVAGARERGVSWRELAAGLRVAAMTLHGQYQSGRGVIAVGPTDGEPPADQEAADGADGSADPGGPAPADQGGGPRRGGRFPGTPLDQLVGRERELADLRPLASRSRLVTLTGPAGVGKTRLATEFALRVQTSYRGRVWWVELAPLTDGSQVASAVVTAAAGRQQPDRTAGDVVVDACGTRPALLVLDNCEHVIDDSAALVAELLAGCPRLRVLATSREGLQIRGESLFPVGPLAVPARQPGTATDVRHVDSVRLFTNRARAIQPGFELTDELAPTIAQLCVQLDGLPLAIELAARQVGMLAPAQLLQRLDNRLTLLAGGRRDAPAHHRSLRAAIEWSYDLLDSDEQAVFRRLAVLPGGFDQQVAAAICADLGLATDRLWLVLTGLAGKSVVVPESPPGTVGRFRMLESLRAYGQDRLAACGELAGAHQRLLAWLAEHAGRVLSIELAPAEDVEARLDQERHNLHYAVQVAERTHDRHYPLLAVALAIGLHRRGEQHQAKALLEHVLAEHADATPVHARALVELSVVLNIHGEYVDAKRHAVAGLELARTLGHQDLILQAVRQLSHVHQILGDLTTAVALQRQRVAILREHGQPTSLAGSLNHIAWILAVIGQLEEASEAVTEAMSYVDPENLPNWFGPAQHTAGTIAFLRGELDRANACFTVALLTPAMDLYHVPYNVDGLALVAARTGEAERALRLLAAVSHARAAIGLAVEPWWRGLRDEAIAVAQAQLPEPRASAATADGAALTLAQAMTYALHDRWPPPSSRRLRTSVLTTRERRVADLVAEGLTNAQIAARLGVSPRTIATHLEHIRTKLDLPTRAHIAAWVTNNRTADAESAGSTATPPTHGRKPGKAS